VGELELQRKKAQLEEVRGRVDHQNNAHLEQPEKSATNILQGAEPEYQQSANGLCGDIEVLGNVDNGTPHVLPPHDISPQHKRRRVAKGTYDDRCAC
jgi:hypothetical protein